MTGVSLDSLLALGFLLGVRHATEADHLAAISTIVTERRSLLRSRARPDPRRLPGNTYSANYICNIQRSAGTDAPARPSLYGHGLLGDAGEVGARNVEELGNENNVLVCAADWIGMAEEDVGNAIAILQDLSGFPSLAASSKPAR